MIRGQQIRFANVREEKREEGLSWKFWLAYLVEHIILKLLCGCAQKVGSLRRKGRLI